MIEIGRSLPNLTGPTSTIGAAEIAALNDLILFAATMPVETCSINPLLRLCRLEYQGCAKGYLRWHDQPPVKISVAKPALAKQRFRLVEIIDGKSHGVEHHRLPDRLGRDAEPLAIGRRPHDLDIAVPGMRHDAM